MKAIFLKNVCIGDVVCNRDGMQHEVIDVSEPYVMHGITLMSLHFKRGSRLENHPTDVIGLVHRPWPEGKTEQDLAEDIFRALRTLPNGYCDLRSIDIVRTLCQIREAIEAYELGKPLAVPVPEEDSCKMGHCKHSKNFAGMCLVYLMNNPTPRECRS